MVSHTPHAAMRSRSNPLTHIRAVSMQQGRARVGRPGELKWLLLRAEGRVAAGVVQVAVVACADALAWRPGVWKDPLALDVPRQSREAQPRAEPAAERTLFSRPFIEDMREFINAKFACMQGMHSMSRGNSASGLQERKPPQDCIRTGRVNRTHSTRSAGQGLRPARCAARAHRRQ